MATAVSGGSVFDRRIAALKDILALSRDFVLVALFLLLLAAPAFIGDRLSSAGFEEGSVMGFKWKKKAERLGDTSRQLEQALLDAQRQLASQADVIKRNQALINELSISAGD